MGATEGRATDSQICFDSAYLLGGCAGPVQSFEKGTKVVVGANTMVPSSSFTAATKPDDSTYSLHVSRSLRSLIEIWISYSD